MIDIRSLSVLGSWKIIISMLLGIDCILVARNVFLDVLGIEFGMVRNYVAPTSIDLIDFGQGVFASYSWRTLGVLVLACMRILLDLVMLIVIHLILSNALRPNILLLLLLLREV